MGSILHTAHAQAGPAAEAEALAFDAEFGSTRFERAGHLTYFSVPAEYFGAVIVGCYYEPSQPARPSSWHSLVACGDPGDPAEGGECEVIEVWFKGAEIGDALTDSAVGCMASAVLAGRGVSL